MSDLNLCFWKERISFKTTAAHNVTLYDKNSCVTSFTLDRLFTCVVLLLSFHPPRQPEGTCNCSSGSEGILDPDKCNQSTGQCSCLMGYTGLQCEECEEEYFTNGTSGCLPCSCDSFGALNLDCDRSGCFSSL
ncbi:hypothetical protein AMECASPLE_036312 [Ameca splendens]|uniref:Laminin EGF-like domain-containing protein n=1 Tax=Ameca splendens TaxID=208324 RepID=A0ABV0YJW2_9TELE